MSNNAENLRTSFKHSGLKKELACNGIEMK